VAGPVAAARHVGWALHVDDRLAEALADAAGSSVSEIGDALPILALALQRMVEKRRRPDGHIDLKPEDAREFIETAVVEATEDALKRAGTGTDDLRRLVIPRLATWDPKAGAEGAAKRQVANAADLFVGLRMGLRTLADALVGLRLLTRSGTAGGVAYEIAHEALLRVRPLGPLIYERRERFEQARVVEIEARDWNAAGRVAGRLARTGDRLGEAQKLLEDEDFGPDLEEAGVADYLAACAAHENEQTNKQRRIIGRAFVTPAMHALEDGRHERALRLAAAGALLASDPCFKLVPELWGPAARAIYENSTRAVLKGRSGPVSIASFSPDGRRIVTTSSDGTARVWDLESGAEIAVLKEHNKESVQSASFSPDGRRLAIISNDTAWVWDVESGTEIAVLEGQEGVQISPDGRWIATASYDGTVQVWDVESGIEISVLEGYELGVTGMLFGPDGCLVTASSDFGEVRVWDVKSGTEIAFVEGVYDCRRISVNGSRIAAVDDDGTEITVFEGPEDWAQISPDGRRIATASFYDGTARMWDLEGIRNITFSNGHQQQARSASFSPDGRRIVTISDDQMAQVWDMESGTEIAFSNEHKESTPSASFSPDGCQIVTASYDGTARVRDVKCRIEIAVLKGHENWVRSASFSPDGRWIVTASSDGRARLWDVARGTETAVFNGERALLGASFDPDGRRIVTASEDGTACLWDVANGTEPALLKGHEKALFSASFSPDGRRIVTASEDGTARVWDVDSRTEIVLLECPQKVLWRAEFAPNGCHILTASSDNMARIWDVDSGKVITLLEGHTDWVRSASFSPNGRRILTASDDGTVRMWDVGIGITTVILNGHKDSVQSASFSPDGRRIVTASADKTARVWDADSGTEIAILKGHELPVRSASFSPDGRRIVTGSEDGTARVWDVSRTEAVVRERGIVLAAALARGIGWRSDDERTDLLMQDAEDDLYAEALRQLGRTSDDPKIAEVAAALAAPLHPNCYLSPTQFAEKFAALTRPRRRQ
jgi:WD40 repeat protein